MPLPRNTSLEDAFPVMCVTNEFMWKEHILSTEPGLVYQGHALRRHGGRSYDVLTFRRAGDGEQFRFYFDVTAVNEVGSLLLKESDLPPLNRRFPLPELFGEMGEGMVAYAARRGLDLSGFALIFQSQCSETAGKRVATWVPHEQAIEVASVRAYDREHKVPCLHGTSFWTLMVMHQFQHVLDGHAMSRTEHAPRRPGTKPRPGKDCVAFTELPGFSFAADLLNYTLFTHKPKAFESPAECKAFGAALSHGLQEKLFDAKEVLGALRKAAPPPVVRDALEETILKAHKMMTGG